MAGVSDNENKQVIKGWIDDLKPMTVLDVGAGMGTYSMLARDEGQYWTALEVFYPYVNQYALRDKYDRIIIGDARYIDYEKLDNYDLTIVADMLEHMKQSDAKDLIDELLDNCKHLLICFPIEHQDQHAGEEGNDFETHVEHWTEADMDDYLENSIGITPDRKLVGDVLAYYMVEGNA